MTVFGELSFLLVHPFYFINLEQMENGKINLLKNNNNAECVLCIYCEYATTDLALFV